MNDLKFFWLVGGIMLCCFGHPIIGMICICIAILGSS